MPPKPIPFKGFLLCAALAWAASAEAAYVVTSFDVPGSSYTDIWDISDTGKLVGTAVTDRQFGYVYDSGALLRLDGPAGAAFSNALGISETGTVVGAWGTDPATGLARGFIYSGGAYTTVDAPFAGASNTNLRAISPDGRYVAGTYTTPTTSLGSFVLDRSTGTFTPVGLGVFDIAQGINSAGQMVGSVGLGASKQSFIYDINTGAITYFGFSGARSVSARGINDHGLISGWLLSGASGPGDTVAWIGNNAGYQTFAIGVAGATTIGEGINNLGQVAGPWSDVAGNTHGFIATPAVLPVDTSAAGVYTFSTAVVADAPIFIDPRVAIGYEYRIGNGDPLFKTVSLPLLGFGDNKFLIHVGAASFEVSGNEIFDFTAHGFANGVAEFSVTGIEPQGLLDPLDATAFATRLTFAGSGLFTGTQSALAIDFTPAVPEPSTWVSMLAGLALLGAAARRAQAPLRTLSIRKSATASEPSVVPARLPEV